MKKIFIVLLMFLLVINQFEPQSSFSLLNYFSGEYIAYTNVETEAGTNFGYCKINSMPTSVKVVGETMVLYGCEVANAIETLRARVVKTEYMDSGVTIIYAYSKLINESNVNKNKVNLQFAIEDERVMIGWPQIIGFESIWSN